jgi:hypothetical protein
LLTVVTVEQIRRVALSLPRAYEAVVRDQVKFRVGQIVFVALSRDETAMGFGLNYTPGKSWWYCWSDWDPGRSGPTSRTSPRSTR